MSELAGSQGVARVLLIGATGLVGRAVIEAAVGNASVQLVGLARREMPLPKDARMELVVADPADWPATIALVAPDVVVIALGTTIAAVDGDRAAFRAVDHDLVLGSAAAAWAAGVAHVIVVSSVGADAASRNFYLGVKGQAETALRAIGFARLDILRPGLLIGRRGGPLRLGEQIGQWLSPLVDPLLRGSWQRFRSVRARDLARVILTLAQRREPGTFVHDNAGFRALLRR